VLFELARPLRSLANRLERGDGAAAIEADRPELRQRGALLVELAAVLGLKAEASTGTSQAGGAEEGTTGETAEIEALIEQRRAAKAARDFAAADRIRDQLKAQGIELVDRPGGVTEWLRS
jgi:cysteinyl-tRNA synthetase